MDSDSVPTKSTTEVRDELSSLISNNLALEAGAKPPVVQELVLARRSLEDARMRLGVAEAYTKGFDPWANQVDKKD